MVCVCVLREVCVKSLMRMDKNFKALDVPRDNLVAFGHPDDLKWLGPWSLES